MYADQIHSLRLSSGAGPPLTVLILHEPVNASPIVTIVSTSQELDEGSVAHLYSFPL